jgi:hypothetical protein
LLSLIPKAAKQLSLTLIYFLAVLLKVLQQIINAFVELLLRWIEAANRVSHPAAPY